MSKKKKAIRILKSYLSEIDSSNDILSTNINVYAESVRTFLNPESKLPKSISEVILIDNRPIPNGRGVQIKKSKLKTYLESAITHIEAFGVYENDRRNLLDGETNTKIISIGLWLLAIGFSAGVGFSEIKNMLLGKNVNHVKYEAENKNETHHDVDSINRGLDRR